MVRQCIVCKNNENSNPNLVFRRFPMNPERREMWLQLLGLENVRVSKFAQICSNHFDASDIKITEITGRRQIRPEADPQLSFLFNEPLSYSSDSTENGSSPIKHRRTESIEPSSVPASRTSSAFNSRSNTPEPSSSPLPTTSTAAPQRIFFIKQEPDTITDTITQSTSQTSLLITSSETPSQQSSTVSSSQIRLISRVEKDGTTTSVPFVINPQPTSTPVTIKNLAPGSSGNIRLQNISSPGQTLKLVPSSSLNIAPGSKPSTVIPSKITVNYLKTVNFLKLSQEDKLKIKEFGRPTPQLSLICPSKSRQHDYVRRFNVDMYTKSDWICGCETQNAIFCFPCLLFGGDNSWTKHGITDLVHLLDKLRKHETTDRHLKNMLCFGLLEQNNLINGESAKNLLFEQNEAVRKNRAVLSKIIDFLAIYAKFSLMQVNSLDERSFFQNVIDFMVNSDSSFKSNIESNVLFQENIDDIINHALECILKIFQDHIKAEIQSANFVSVILNDTSYASERNEIAIFFRYVYNNNIQERLWGFFSPASSNAGDVAQCILDQLQIALGDSVNKLISQSYDGITDGERGEVHKIVEATYPNAHFLQSYTHDLHQVLIQVASRNHLVKVFFSSLDAIPQFFKTYPQYLNHLKSIRTSLSGVSNFQWDFNTNTISLIYENKETILNCFKDLTKKNKMATVQSAAAIVRILEDTNFVFWLEFFYRIESLMETLCFETRSGNNDPILLNCALKTFNESITEIIDSIFAKTKTTAYLEDGEPLAKRIKSHNDPLKMAAEEVCVAVTFHMNERLRFKDHLTADKLFHSSEFYKYLRVFPTKDFESAAKSYPILKVEEDKLKTELGVIYDRIDLQQSGGPFKFYKLLQLPDLKNPFQEVLTLLEIILTTPMTSFEPERRLTTTSDIRKVMVNTECWSPYCLSALVMLCFHKSMLSSISDFNGKVIEKFSKFPNYFMYK